jgi:predicted DCC family thiol-disulfide oxidoreductase YuxK
MNNMKSQQYLKVYYDGLCKVCSQEINHYRRQEGAENIQFIDICGAGFDAIQEEVDPVQVHKVMHVRRQDGTLATKVEAFIEIWKALPKYRFLAKIAGRPPVRSMLNLSYLGFSLIRPFLPRYSSPKECQDSPYCDLKKA